MERGADHSDEVDERSPPLVQEPPFRPGAIAKRPKQRLVVNGGVKIHHLGGVKIHHWRLGSLST